jgi:sodium transport system ATP-binding protein
MIEVSHIKKHFGSVVAVDDVSLRAEDGQITGLLGPNGAGKTTTLRAISSLIQPDAGQVMVDDIDAARYPNAARRRLGVLPDARGLYARLTARENIRYFGELYGMPRRSIDARIDALSGLLDMGEIIERRVAGFSQGERMKVAIARALIHEPQNVLLDEPTSGLDVMSTRAMRRFVCQLRDQGRCVIFSSHIMQEVAALCDDIIIVAHGRVVAHGSPDALREQAGIESLEEVFVKLTVGDRYQELEAAP